MQAARWRKPILTAVALFLLLTSPWGQASRFPAPVAWQPPPPLAPQADDCHGPGVLRVTPGAASANEESDAAWGDADLRTREKKAMSGRATAPAAVLSAKPDALHREMAAADSAGPSEPLVQPIAPEPPVPAPGDKRRAGQQPVVTAGMVDDNADFGAYLAYRERNAQLPVRARDVSERYLLQVQDATGRPVPDAEVALQPGGGWNPGGQQQWMVRTDAAGRAWLHPRAVFGGAGQPEVLQVQARKDGATGATLLRRGQREALQLRLDRATVQARARLDLVFLIDATGSMSDEIAKLNASLQTIARQIAALPARPDICMAMVAYRDRGDAFLIRAHDFTDRLDDVQHNLAQLRAGGGGDTPEALNEAWHETVNRLSWRKDASRLVVLVADAPPHLDYGQPYYDEDLLSAQALGIKLFAVGASGLDQVGEYVFRQMAQYTGGRFVFLTYRDASDPGSGPGTQTVHDVQNYSVQTLDRLIVKLVRDELAGRTGA
ncbi:MAG: VWA domain-containing protein [Aquabacterium sp.]|nr:MAG: VWA domain-containing protein [Aquabacterium sp.]